MYCQKCGAENQDNANICTNCSWVLTSTAAVPQADAKTSGAAIASLVLGILSPFTCLLTALPAVICGIVGLVKISKSKGQLKGTGLAITGMALPAIAIPVVAMLLAILMPALSKVRAIASRTVCATNMTGLGSAIMVYANDYDDRFPTADKWCDLLIENADVPEMSFRCHRQPEGSFSYAFNKNLDGLTTDKVGADVVLLFEIEYSQKNATGGAEMISTSNHEGQGCYVLFTDGHVEFVKDQHIPRLKWKIQEDSGVIQLNQIAITPAAKYTLKGSKFPQVMP